MKDLFSKPVLATFLAAIAIVAAAIWFHRPAPPAFAPMVTNSAPEPVTVKATPPPAPNPAPVAAQDNGGLPPVIPISLTNVIIDAENGSWVKDKDYLVAPHKPQEFGGVLFLMDGMLQLQGKMSKGWKKRDYREDIVVPITLTNETAQGTEIIERGTNIASLHLLGATRYGGSGTEPFVDIIWHYTDGSTLRTPIEYLTHFRDWVRPPYEEPAHLPYLYSKVVWTAPQPSNPDQNVRLYRTTFPNPAPNKVISELEFSSTMMDPTLFIVGVTLDPLMPGLRPDTTPDLEPTDAVPPKKIQILVENSDGQPVPQAKLEVVGEIHKEAKISHTSSHLTTDGAGALEVNYPPENLYQLTITASQEDYGSRKMVWNLSAGDTVPDSYTIKLGGAFSIGGVVLAPDGTPLPEASIMVYHYNMGNDSNKRGEQPDFQTKNATTDADGKWQVKGLPIELMGRIGFNASHAGYLTTNINLMNNASAEGQLRDGTFTITLHQGIAVAGRVVDDSDNPIPGASVSAGQRYSGDRRTAKTDDEGHFTLTNVPEGNVIFSATADGKAPDEESFAVKPDMGEIVLKLAAGKIVKAIVQDTNGTPIAGVHVQLQNYGPNNAYDFSTNTDATGRFEWDSAPADPQMYSFSKEGYEDKNSVSLPPDKDNTVMMRQDRQIQGQVVDADSGQPITKFTIRSGQLQRWSSNTNQLMGSNSSHDFSSQDGTFTLSLTQESDDGLEASADDYAPQTEQVPAAQNGVIQMTIKLTSNPGLRGKVVLPDGTPAPGVSVVITHPGQNGGNAVQFQGNHFSSWGGGIPVATTDANGQFVLGSPPLTGGGVAAAGDAGYVEESVDQFRANTTLVLQPYGQIQGTLTIGGQPGVGVELYFNKNNEGINTDFNGFKTTTDTQGQFNIANVPPGDGQIVRLVQMQPNTWTWSDYTPVSVKPGEVTQVNIGDSGAVIRGTVRFDNPPTNNQSFIYEGNLSLNQSQPSATQLNKYYAFAVNADGSFSVDDVVPGNYNLHIMVTKNINNPWMHQIASGNTQVTVPDSFSPATPIDVGEVELKPSPQAN